ncbi:putative vesicular acetylcholine transporter-B isoform X2 [Clavelina lepadiformis]|uniref:putative vesicular acetylcholine transporter-B isoform X2 n=1 Tax=Clavelina lepadiformis TaxID=159417 RepID=UPI004041C05D
MEATCRFRGLVYTFVYKGIKTLRDLCAPIRNRISDTKSQKRLILFIVCVALLLDNMLYMVIVPIITEYFKTTKNENLTTTASPPHHNATIAMQGFSADMDGDESFLLQNSSSTFTQLMTKSFQKSKSIFPDIKPPQPYEGNEDALTGVLFASKAIVQLMANPFTGTFIDRVGYITPLTLGLMVMFISTSLFACAESLGLLFLARSMQGLGSALADTASLGLIADRYHDEAERSKALGIALAFISFGSLVAPPFGGVLCEFAGKEWPFLILASICMMDALLLLLVQIPASDEQKAKDGNVPVGTPIYKLFVDPYIAVIAISLTIANFPLAFLEPTIAKWMEDTMNASKWKIGLVWLPAFLPHVIGVCVTVYLSTKYFRYQWLYGALGLVLIGVSTVAVPTCKSFVMLMLPLAVLCFGIALIDTALLPTLAFLVDVRHTSVYGSVYAIADISYSVAYSLGPILAGQTVHVLGYLKMNIGIGLLNMMFCPLLLFLREVYDWTPDRGERVTLLNGESVHEEIESSTSRKSDKESESVCVVHHRRKSSVTSSEAIDKDTASGCSLIHKIPSQNGHTDIEKLTDTGMVANEDKIVETSIAPRPRPRKASLVKQHDLLDAQATVELYSTTKLNGEVEALIIKKSARKSFPSQTSLSRGELKHFADENGVGFHNPLFESPNRHSSDVE